jgi:cob(I)alamin adenosyltransferase
MGAAGQLHVYTGDGKGKTTAALGLALRACGAGLRVCVLQFAKGRPCSELAALARLGVRVARFGQAHFIRGEPDPEDRAAARAGLEEARQALTGGAYDVVVLDEASVAVQCGLFSANALLEVLAARRPEVEAVVTGRGAHPKLIECADLVTEMRNIRHYYHHGVPARKGIED